MTNDTPSRSTIRLTRAVLWTLGAISLTYSLQAVAVWLPWRWAYQFAANATVWPQLQVATIVVTAVIGIILWRSGSRKISVALEAGAVVCLVPMLQMLAGLHDAARLTGTTISPASIVDVRRSVSSADRLVRYTEAGGPDLSLSRYDVRFPGIHPVVVYVHGGGWSGGSRDENSGFFRWLNGQGYDVVSVDYRVATDTYASWQDAPRDVACALIWVAKNASVNGYDAGDVTVMGDSAGGQLALRAAYGAASGDVSPSCTGAPAIPRRVIGIVPAVDFRELYDDPRLGTTSRTNVVRYLGGTPSIAAEAYDGSTIMTHVKAGLPPTLIINAANDTLVSAASGVRLAEALRAAGNNVQQYTIPYAAHSYWINPGGYQTQISRTLILGFLKK